MLPMQLKNKCLVGIFLVVLNLKLKLIIGCTIVLKYKARLNMDRKFMRFQIYEQLVVEDFCKMKTGLSEEFERNNIHCVMEVNKMATLSEAQ